MIPDLDLAGAVCWLLEGEGNECAEQLENAALDRRWLGEFLDPLPAEGHGLAVEGERVVEQVAVFRTERLSLLCFAPSLLRAVCER